MQSLPIATNMVSKSLLISVLRRGFSLAAILYIASNIVLYTYQRDLIYFPTEATQHSFERFTLNNDVGKLNIIQLNSHKNDALIYFGGNNENVVKGAEGHLKNFPNQTIYLVDYRGYGSSSGQPSEEGFNADALILYDHLQTKHQSISVMGRSLGTGVATYLAVNRIIKKLILVTPYDSIEAIAKLNYPLFPVGLLIKDPFDSISRAPSINAPTLIIVAEKDRIIPLRHSLRLIHAFKPERLQVKAFKHAGHGDVSHLAEYDSVIRKFMQD